MRYIAKKKRGELVVDKDTKVSLEVEDQESYPFVFKVENLSTNYSLEMSAFDEETREMFLECIQESISGVKISQVFPIINR